MKISRSLIWTLFVLICTGPVRAETKVSAQPTPFPARRTKSVTDTKGSIHLIFNQDGNIFYSRRDTD